MAEKMEDVGKMEKTGIAVPENYARYKAQLDTELQRTAVGFIRIGYLLRLARDTDILKESQYGNVNEFAQAEYNLDKTAVSRFININRKFGDPEKPGALLPHYQDFGYAKLSLMLSLPDEVNDVLTPEYSKAEIQAVKEETDAENRISDLEVMMEEKGEAAFIPGILRQSIYQLFSENPDLYVRLWEDSEKGGKLTDTLAPAGDSTYIVRIAGVGRMVIAIHQGNVSIVNMRHPEEKETFDEEQISGAFRELVHEGGTPEASWEKVYGTKFPQKEPEKTAVAPVQRKEPRVTKAQTAKPKSAKTQATKAQTKNTGGSMEAGDETRESIHEPDMAAVETSIQVQEDGEQGAVKPVPDVGDSMTLNDIDRSFPVPDPKASEEEQQEEAGDLPADPPLPGQMGIADFPEVVTGKMPYSEHMLRGYKAGIKNRLSRMMDLYGQQCWEKLLHEAEDVAWACRAILEETEGRDTDGTGTEE